MEVKSRTPRRTALPSSRLAALAEEWLDERRTIGRGISSQTEAAYRRDLTNWATIIAENTGKPEPEPPPADADGAKQDPFLTALGRLDVEDLSLENVKRALASMARRDYAPASRGRMLAALRGFCRWLVIEGHMVSDPTIHLGNPSIPNRMP